MKYVLIKNDSSSANVFILNVILGKWRYFIDTLS